MRHLNRSAVFGLFWSLASSSAVEGETSEAGECRLYVAPSSTSTNTELVWGLYAGTDYAKDDLVDDYELGVNMFNLRAHNSFDESVVDDEQQVFVNGMISFLEGFMWVPEPAGAKFESGDPKVTYIPGAGILSAMNHKMTNAQWSHYRSYHRPMVGELPGIAHPGRGAQTPFYNIAVKATDEIKKGTEIFLSYGANYDEDEEGDLDKSDYEKLDETIQKMVEFFDKHESELDEKAKRQIYTFLTRDLMNAAVGPTRQKSVGRILPNHPDELRGILEAGGSMKFDQRAAFRDMEWLEEHGFCADNIQVAASTVPGAGRGAFAKRFLKSGATIAGTPLIAIPDSSIFEMHPLSKNEDGIFEIESEAIDDFQLVVNYCFGHPESSMVLLPAGAGVAFINHSKKPNAKLTWSDHPATRDDWFHMDPHELIEEEQAFMGLVMEVVALRDIQPGEEIFLDYGDEWVTAWEQHKAQWEEIHKGATWPIKALELNDKYQKEPFPTEEENFDPYPEHVSLVAFIMIKESTAAGTLEDPKDWDIPETGTVYDADNLFEASIVKRHALDDGKSFNYTLRWVNVRGEATYVENVPHDAFLLVDLPGTSDHFTPSAFRHPIGIPDDVFPQGPWRNLGEHDEEEDYEEE